MIFQPKPGRVKKLNLDLTGLTPKTPKVPIEKKATILGRIIKRNLKDPMTMGMVGMGLMTGGVKGGVSTAGSVANILPGNERGTVPEIIQQFKNKEFSKNFSPKLNAQGLPGKNKIPVI